MRNLFTIWRRELMACFLSPVAYITGVFFLAMTGGTFLLGVFSNTNRSESLPALLYGSIVIWMTFLVTVISMRLFAEEKKSGTIETLLTAPVTDGEVILGKYAGALTFMLLVMLPAVSYIYILSAVGPGLGAVDTGAVVCGGVEVLLLGAMFMAEGLLVSLMTCNQIVAAICCFCAVWVTLLAGWILSVLPIGLGKVVSVFSVAVHIDDFARGSVDTRPIVLYVSVMLLLLFVATRLLESRRWK